jgi:hypothetical protein
VPTAPCTTTPSERRCMGSGCRAQVVAARTRRPANHVRSTLVSWMCSAGISNIPGVGHLSSHSPLDMLFIAGVDKHNDAYREIRDDPTGETDVKIRTGCPRAVADPACPAPPH